MNWHVFVLKKTGVLNYFSTPRSPQIFFSYFFSVSFFSVITVISHSLIRKLLCHDGSQNLLPGREMHGEDRKTVEIEVPHEGLLCGYR